jgi:hypothetical protein
MRQKGDSIPVSLMTKLAQFPLVLLKLKKEGLL